VAIALRAARPRGPGAHHPHARTRTNQPWASRGPSRARAVRRRQRTTQGVSATSPAAVGAYAGLCSRQRCRPPSAGTRLW